jgi:radical SAM superfamily enzyme YgiQ (UPF0313 family)
MIVRCKYRVLFLLLFSNLIFSSEKNLKILTFNVWSGLDYNGICKVGEYESELRRENRFNSLVAQIRSLDPDIIFLQEEILDYLYKAGCRILFIGMETVSQSNLDNVNKNYTVQCYADRVRNIRKAGIKIAGYFMFGLDVDTYETSGMVYEFIRKTRIAVPILNILIPAPGTKIFERLQNEGRLLFADDQDLLQNNSFYNSACNTCFYVPKSMTPEDAEKGFLELNRKLASYYQIFRRSADLNPLVALFLLGMNIGFRKEYLKLRRIH